MNELNKETEMLGCVYAIEAIAQLMQKAFDSNDDSTTGVYGSAVILESKAQRMLELLGQS